MLSLLGFSLLLFILSFFLQDPYKKIQEDIDNLSIQQIQDMYKVKKKLKLLEEELLIDDAVLNDTIPANSTSHIHEIIKNQVWSLAAQGVSIQKIATQSSLTVQQVQQILHDGLKKGE